MRKVNVSKITETVRRLCVLSNTDLRGDIKSSIKKAALAERSKKARKILNILLDNASIAKKEGLPLCQDTGVVVVYVSLGQKARVVGGDLKQAINKGVKKGYSEAYFRRSISLDPLLRKGDMRYTPAVIYVDIVKGDKIKITVSPKGFGSENKSRIKMLNPTDGKEAIKQFVLSTVKDAGPNACPPYILGIGIGGTFEKAALLAKKALLVSVDKKNPKQHLSRLEQEIQRAVNKLNIGPAGLGGKCTCLGVNILSAPTHIAGLPVAVNVGCHSTRSKSATV